MTTYSYTTAERVQAELQASAAFASTTIPSLTTINTWIADASAYVNQLNNEIPYGVSTFSQTIDYNGEDIIPVKNSPITTFNSLTYYTADLGTSDYATSGTVLTVDTHFTVKANSGEIIFLSGFAPKDGLKRFIANYDSGYDPVPATVGMYVTKSVAHRVLNTLLNQNVNDRADGGSISVGSISIVEPASYGVNSYKQLGQDLKDMEQDLITTSGVFRYE